MKPEEFRKGLIKLGAYDIRELDSAYIARFDLNKYVDLDLLKNYRLSISWAKAYANDLTICFDKDSIKNQFKASNKSNTSES